MAGENKTERKIDETYGARIAALVDSVLKQFQETMRGAEEENRALLTSAIRQALASFIVVNQKAFVFEKVSSEYGLPDGVTIQDMREQAREESRTRHTTRGRGGAEPPLVGVKRIECRKVFIAQGTGVRMVCDRNKGHKGSCLGSKTAEELERQGRLPHG